MPHSPALDVVIYTPDRVQRITHSQDCLIRSVQSMNTPECSGGTLHIETRAWHAGHQPRLAVVKFCFSVLSFFLFLFLSFRPLLFKVSCPHQSSLTQMREPLWVLVFRTQETIYVVTRIRVLRKGNPSFLRHGSQVCQVA